MSTKLRGKWSSAVGALAVALGGALVSAPAEASGVTTCDGYLRNQTVRTDLVVPPAAYCELSKVTVQGKTRVDGNLVALDSRLKGDVTARKNAYFNGWRAHVEGDLTFDRAWGGYLSESTITGNVNGGGILFTTNGTRVHGDYTVSTYLDRSIDKATIDGDLTVSGHPVATVRRVQVGGATRIQARIGADLEDSRVAGDAFVSAQSVRLTGNQFANIETTGTMIGFSGNVVQGTADAWCGVLTLQGEGNTFNGPLLRKFSEVFGGDETACPPDPWETSASARVISSETPSAKASTARAPFAQAPRADSARSTAAALATMKAKTAKVRTEARAAGEVTAAR